MHLDITRIHCLIRDVGNGNADSLKGISASFDYVIWESIEASLLLFFFKFPLHRLDQARF